MFGILRDVCLAGNSVDARLAAGGGSVGGSGAGGVDGKRRRRWEERGHLVRRAGAQLTAGHKKERV